MLEAEDQRTKLLIIRLMSKLYVQLSSVLRSSFNAIFQVLVSWWIWSLHELALDLLIALENITFPLQLVTLFLGVLLWIRLWHCLVVPCVPGYSSWGAVGTCEHFHLCCHLCLWTCSLLPSRKHPSRLYLCTFASHFYSASTFLQLSSQSVGSHEKFQRRSWKDSEEIAKYWKT